MRIALTFLLYILFSSYAFANTAHFSVSGKIVDDITQKPLSYATIKILNMELCMSLVCSRSPLTMTRISRVSG